MEPLRHRGVAEAHIDIMVPNLHGGAGPHLCSGGSDINDLADCGSDNGGHAPSEWSVVELRSEVVVLLEVQRSVRVPPCFSRGDQSIATWCSTRMPDLTGPTPGKERVADYFAAYAEQIKSDVADLKNVGDGRWGGAITAAKFLERFVGGIPWTHVDIAGPAFSEKSRPWTDGGGTGAMVRPLVELARGGE